MVRKNLKQIAAFHDKTIYQFLLCGRQSGKTTLMKWKLAQCIANMPANSDIFYIGPTNQQAMDLVWDPFKDLFEYNRWKVKSHKQAQTFTFSNKRKVYVIGAEKIRRVRGHRAFHIFCDEVGFYSTPLKYVWEACEGALATVNGGLTMATTPPGKATDAYDWYLDHLSKPDWNFHSWASIDNPAISKEFIERAKANSDPRSFRQEYEASWESYEGLAYYNFDEKVHIKKQEDFNDNLPVILHFDFNVNPTTLLVGQRYQSLYSMKKEYSLKNSSTERTIEAFCEDHKDKAGRWLLKIRGDSSGRSRSSTTGYADYHYIHQALNKYGFKYQHEVPAANPPIVDRVRHVNSYLKNCNGQHKIEFDPSMADTIKDLSSQETDGRFPVDKNNLGHKADAVGYGVYWDWMKTREIKSSSILL
ncbi:hypothetical protein EKK58_08610 [Candidatus Dependentiae bacterium]|nr:MAG: hypothetical protein EKK58_08610 [Candidatus Dependentiae bacterium]